MLEIKYFCNSQLNKCGSTLKYSAYRTKEKANKIFHQDLKYRQQAQIPINCIDNERCFNLSNELFGFTAK